MQIRNDIFRKTRKRPIFFARSRSHWITQIEPLASHILHTLPLRKAAKCMASHPQSNHSPTPIIFRFPSFFSFSSPLFLLVWQFLLTIHAHLLLCSYPRWSDTIFWTTHHLAGSNNFPTPQPLHQLPPHVTPILRPHAHGPLYTCTSQQWPPASPTRSPRCILLRCPSIDPPPDSPHPLAHHHLSPFPPYLCTTGTPLQPRPTSSIHTAKQQQ